MHQDKARAVLASWGYWRAGERDSRGCLGYGKHCMTGLINSGEIGGGIAGTRVPTRMAPHVVLVADRVIRQMDAKIQLAAWLQYVASQSDIDNVVGHGTHGRFRSRVTIWKRATGLSERRWHQVQSALARAVGDEIG